MHGTIDGQPAAPSDGEAAEPAPSAADAQLREVLDGIGEAFYALDRDLRLLHVSRKALELWGRRAEEVVGRPLLEAFPHAAGGEPYRMQLRAIRTGRPERLTFFSAPMRRWIELDATPGRTGLFVTLRDVDRRKRAEDALRESEDRFRSFAENSAGVLWIMDANTRRLVYLNSAYERIWGEPREAVMRDLSRWTDLVHPEDAGRHLAALPRLLAGEMRVEEYRIRRRDGGERWIRDTAFPIRGADGRVVRVAGIAQDVTEEREAQEALRSSEARLRVLSEAIPQLVWISRAGGHWDWAGPQWQAFTGLSDEASRGRGWLAGLHPEDRAGAEAAWREASGEGRSRSLDVEFRVLRRDGECRWFRTRAEPLPTEGEEGGAGPRWFGACTDVDDLRRAEQALRASQVRFRAVADALPQILWSARADGSMDYFNRRWLDFTGLSRERSRGRGWAEILHPDDRAHALERWERSLRTGESYEAEFRLRGGDGGYRWFISRAMPVRGADGRVTHWFGTCTDLDDIVRAREVLTHGRKGLERLVAGRTADLRQAVDALHAEVIERERTEDTLRQAQKMEAVGQLTGGLAHDLNNMLQGVMGGLEMVQQRIAEGRIEETASHIEASLKSVERAAALTRRLLGFARPQTLDPRPICADALVLGMEELIRRTVGPAIEVELRMGDGDWTVLCDANQLENALLNLAINARDAMPDGGRLVIGTRHVPLSAAQTAGQEGASPGDYLEIAVGDTGAGMTPEVLARAFEPFFTTKPAGQGTGLGLSQIRGFVRQSNGIVRLESAPGQGTTVRLLLPRQGPARPDEERQPEPAPEPERGAGETVVLAEDEETVRGLMAARLRGLGYQVLEAGDGPAALRLLRGAPQVDLLVTNVGLPGGLNGRQVAEAAREGRPGLRVLFITGYASGALQDGLGPRMELISKPFTLDALARRVKAMLAAAA